VASRTPTSHRGRACPRLRSLVGLRPISHQLEAVGPGHRKGGASAPPKPGRSASFCLASRAACGRKLRARRGRGIIRGPCNGGAKAPPFRGEKSGLMAPRGRQAVPLQNHLGARCTLLPLLCSRFRDAAELSCGLPAVGTAFCEMPRTARLPLRSANSSAGSPGE